jgi:hypothetical protein
MLSQANHWKELVIIVEFGALVIRAWESWMVWDWKEGQKKLAKKISEKN